MQAGTTYMEWQNQVDGIVFSSICADYRLEALRSKWNTPPNMVENDKDPVRLSDKMLMVNLVVNKQQKKAAVTDLQAT